MDLHFVDIAIIVLYLLGMVVVGFHRRAPRARRTAGLFPRRQSDAVVGAEHVERDDDVRRLGHDVAGVAAVCLRLEERVHSLALAGVQSDLFDGLPLDLAAAIGSDYGRRVDHAAIWFRSAARRRRGSAW